MPSDLLELTRQIQGQSARGAELGEHFLKAYRAGMENEQLRREMEAQQQLRALFARGQQPSMGEIGAINPELAIKNPTFGYDLAYKQSQIGKNLADIDAKNFEMHKNRITAQAGMLMPIIDARDMAIQRGENPEKANAQAMAEIGAKTVLLDQMGIGFLPGSTITDKHTPDDFLSVFNQFGVKSQMQQMQELQNQAFAKTRGESMVPPRMTAGQMYGDYVQMPNGQFIRKPSLNQGGGMGGMGGTGDMGDGMRGTGASVMMRLSDKQLTDLANNNKMPAEQQMAIAELERRYPNMQTINEPSTGGMGGMGGDLGITTPEQYQKNVTKQKAEEAAAVEKAKSEEQERQQMKKVVNQYATLRSPRQIEQIIAASKTGNIDDALRDLGKVFGVATDKGTASAKLKTIVQQFAKLSPFAPGSQSDKEYQARLDEIGAIDSSTPVQERLGQFGEYINQLKQSMIDRGDFSPEQLLRMVNSGHFTQDEAAMIADRLFAAQGAAR